MRQIALFIIALTSSGASNATKQDPEQSQPPAQPQSASKVLPADQPTTLMECLEQALLMNDPLQDQDWRYMGVCAVRFPKVERDAFEALIKPNDFDTTPVRVGNIVRNGLGAADFLEMQAARHAQMPEALRSVLGYWDVNAVDFKNRDYGGNFIAEMSAEAFVLFPRVTTVVDYIEGIGFSRKDRGECIVVAPIDEGSPIAWAEAFYATARHYGIRGRVVVNDHLLKELTDGLRRPRVLSSKQGPEHDAPASLGGPYRATWHLVQIP